MLCFLVKAHHHLKPWRLLSENSASCPAFSFVMKEMMSARDRCVLLHSHITINIHYKLVLSCTCCRAWRRSRSRTRAR